MAARTVALLLRCNCRSNVSVSILILLTDAHSRRQTKIEISAMNSKETDQSLHEKKIYSKNIFSGTLLHVYKDTIELPDGSRSVREWIDHPGAAAVVPVFRNGDVQLVRQFRYPLGLSCLEIPAGKCDPGEAPYGTAVRELEEEAGLLAGKWVDLGVFHPAVGYSNEAIRLYLAWDLEQRDSHTDADEFLQLVRMPFSHAVETCASGKITDGKTITALMLAARWWQQNGPFEVDQLLR